MVSRIENRRHYIEGNTARKLSTYENRDNATTDNTNGDSGGPKTRIRTAKVSLPQPKKEKAEGTVPLSRDGGFVGFLAAAVAFFGLTIFAHKAEVEPLKVASVGGLIVSLIVVCGRLFTRPSNISSDETTDTETETKSNSEPANHKKPKKGEHENPEPPNITMTDDQRSYASN